MEYVTEIRAAQDDAKRLEELYQAARRNKETDEFAAALLACYQESPDSLLYAAWYYRLQQTPAEEPVSRSINWKLAVPLSVLTGFIFWLLSGPSFEFSDHLPYVFIFWAPIAALSVVAFLALTANGNKKAAWLTIAGQAGVGLYVALLTTLCQRQHYRDLMALHLPLSAWIAAGLSVLWRRTDHPNRFAFLIKSVEVFITAGLYALAGGAFVGITVGLFAALRIYLSDDVMRLLIAGGGGLIPLLAVAGAYDPFASPSGQKFEQGLSRLISTLMRLLLPLTLLVLVIYIAVIPFNFMEPFYNRDVLIVYNVLLFAIMLLLIGATPVRADELAARHQSVLRVGIVAVAVLTVLVSLYALSATVYRTVLGGITMNRLTIIGWTLFLIAAIPWLFRE